VKYASDSQDLSYSPYPLSCAKQSHNG